jgi:uncharacterized protein (DUF697 family)
VPGKTPQVVPEPPVKAPQPVDVARWKQADYRRLARHHAAAAADLAFDAEVGLEEPPPAPAAQPWWRRAWHAITHPGETVQKVLITLGQHSPLARQAIVKTAEAVHRSNQALDTAIHWLDAHQSEVSLMVGLTVGTVAVIVTGGGALPLVVALVATAGITGGMTIGLNAAFGRRWTENLGTNLLLGLGGVGFAFLQAWAFQAVMGRVAPPVEARVVQVCQAHPAACGVAQPALWLADKGWNAYDAWQAGRVLKDPEARWEEKWTAGLSLTLAGTSEFLEPDEGGLSLPVDDLARRKVVAEFQERLEQEGAAEALDWLRKTVGEEAFRRWLLRAEVREGNPTAWSYGVLVDMQATGASEEVLRGVRRLTQQIANEKTPPAYRWGLMAELDRAYTWYRKGLLEGVEVSVQGGRADLILVTKEIVEIKYWRQSYARDHIDRLLHQIQTYQATGRPVILELVQTKTEPIPEAFIEKLLRAAQDAHVPLTRGQIHIVTLGEP